MGLVRRLMESSKPFFDLPLEHKREHVVNGMRSGRGYEISPEHLAFMEELSAADRERMASHAEASSRAGILSERFMCGPPLSRRPPDDAYYSSDLGQIYFAPDSWPAEDQVGASTATHRRARSTTHGAPCPQVPGMREGMTSVYDQLELLAYRLMGVFSTSLGLPGDFFSSRSQRHASNLQACALPQTAAISSHRSCAG